MTEKDYTNSVGIIELPDEYVINGHYYDRNFEYINKNINANQDGICMSCSTNVTTIGTLIGLETYQTYVNYNNKYYFINNTKIFELYDIIYY